MADPPNPPATQVETGHWVQERPPPGLAQGNVAWPPWAIVCVTVAALAVALIALAWLARKRARSAPHGSSR